MVVAVVAVEVVVAVVVVMVAAVVVVVVVVMAVACRRCECCITPDFLFYQGPRITTSRDSELMMCPILLNHIYRCFFLSST